MRDILVELSCAHVYCARWTDDIHDEWINAVLKKRNNIPKETLQRTRTLMNEAVPDCLITGYETIVETLNLPDPNDRHVLAAAIVGRCDVIVTRNLKDFPEHVLDYYKIEAQDPDEFLNHQRTLNERVFLECVKNIRKRLNGVSAERYIEIMKKNNLAVIASELEKARSLI